MVGQLRTNWKFWVAALVVAVIVVVVTVYATAWDPIVERGDATEIPIGEEFITPSPPIGQR